MTKNVTVTGGVATSGTIETYEEDQTTTMTAIAMPDFPATSDQSINHFFWIKNTGNVQVKVYWYISSGNPSWSLDTGTQTYISQENSQTKFRLAISNQQNPDGSQGTGYWNPDPSGNQVVTLDTGQSAKFALTMTHFAAVNTPGQFNFVLSFDAKS